MTGKLYKTIGELKKVIGEVIMLKDDSVKNGRRINELAKEYGWTEPQKRYVMIRIKELHKEEDWLTVRLDEKCRWQIIILPEGLEWIEKVHLRDGNTTFLEADTAFGVELCRRRESELIAHGEKITWGYRHYRKMNVSEMTEFFGVTRAPVYTAVKMLGEVHPDWVLSGNPIVITARGVQWVEENYFRKKFREDIWKYKRKLDAMLRSYEEPAGRL